MVNTLLLTLISDFWGGVRVWVGYIQPISALVRKTSRDLFMASEPPVVSVLS